MKTDSGHGGGPALSARVVAALDAGRALAAVYVVLHHLTVRYGAPFPVSIAFRFGQEAVLIFFLLSGFVIFASERERALRPAGYAWRRVRRIYPPLLVAMAVSTLVALDDGRLAGDFSLRALIGTLAGVQDIAALKPGVIVDPYLLNYPLWSLSYELAFYLAFPFVLRLWRARPQLASHVVGAAGCLAYAVYIARPGHFLLMVAYFPIWWTGAMAARAYLDGDRSARALVVPLGWLAALCVVAGAGIVVAGYRGAGVYPMLMLRHFATALLLTAALFGPIGAMLAGVVVRWRGTFAGTAAISYGLYVLHYPLLLQWHRATTPAEFVLAVALLLLLADLVDRRLGRLIRARKPV